MCLFNVQCKLFDDEILAGEILSELICRSVVLLRPALSRLFVSNYAIYQYMSASNFVTTYVSMFIQKASLFRSTKFVLLFMTTAF